MAEMVKAKLNGEFNIVLPKHRAERPEWYIEQGWEKKRLDRLCKRIFLRDVGYEGHPRDPDVVYYVGAEEGEMAALCQMWGARVVLFEPNDLVWPNIKAIWDANKLDYPILCFSGFASNHDSKTGEIYAQSFPPSADGEVIGNHGFKELADPGEIPQVKIDTLVDQTAIVPTIISLDVEGSEWEVLRGAEKTLREYHPTIFLSLHPEFMYHHFKEHSGDLRKWIKDLGYTEELIDYQHEVHLVYVMNDNNNQTDNA